MSGLNLALAEHANGGLHAFRNLLINPEFNINQRAFAGGALAAGTYGFDRWKGAFLGATVSVSSGVVTLNGHIAQVIETPGLASKPITFSVEDPSVTVEFAVFNHLGTLISATVVTAGSGRRSTTAVLDSTCTSNLTIWISTGSTGTFSKPQVEAGRAATPFARRFITIEEMLCKRYYQVYGGASGFPFVFGYQTAGNTIYNNWPLPVEMRATPTVTKLGTWAVTNAAQPVFLASGAKGFQGSAVVTGTGVALASANSADDLVTFSAEL
jgi:hypothetical protein